MQLKQQWNKLKNLKLEKPNSVLTMYLNTDPADPDQQGGEWKIHLKNGLNRFENYLTKDEDKDELHNFQKIRKQVESFFQENQKDLKKGVILFASSDESVWIADIVQVPVETNFYWQETPVIDQLEQIYRDFPRLGIVLVQQNQVKTIEAELGFVEETKLFELDLDTEDWRQHEGPHHADASMGKGGKNTQTDQFDKRFRENQKRWYKRLAPTLDKKAKDQQWEKIYVAGEEHEANDLASYMQKNIDQVIHQNILDQEEHHVLEKIIG
ncbi:VLRF1 family aeRF1-type release factor [Paraliobacillus ryukyuensis]|uniref:VLRF1 family aeRF1-type release factor n=1 Tax=Paraliobacillus ryukyuensis TaxID=200904 RepID=UPI0009A67F9C|nr:VLRF1 family aeRF1-type release factor [Paraliobacillus ryukyuensis]